MLSSNGLLVLLAVVSFDPQGLVVPEGHRAVAIRVSSEPSALGFVMPGSRVDVLVTTKTADGVKTRKVAENLLVLAIDQRPRQPEDKAEAELVVTLAVKPEGIEQLQKAATAGTLSVLLRPIGEK